jgi:hypothetical protein
MHADPDPEADSRSVFAVYGATMLAVQGLENTVNWLYLLTDVLRNGTTTGSTQRQWGKAFARSFFAFQRQAPTWKLNDAKQGIKNELDPDLYADLDRFLSGPRAQLAHRFLVERLRTPDGALLTKENASGVRFRPGTVLELLQVTMHAKELTKRLYDRAEEIRAMLPDAPDAPHEVREFVELMVRVAMFKEFPEALTPPDASVEDGA